MPGSTNGKIQKQKENLSKDEKKNQTHKISVF